MKQNRFVLIAISLLTATLLPSCSKEDKEAMTTLNKIEQLCQSGKQDDARDLLAKTAERNETFKTAFAFATSGLTDKANINPCGQVLTEMKTQIEN